MNISEKNIVTAIILSIVTCGIYGLIWYVNLVNDARLASRDDSLPTGGTALLLTIITCGIYGYYLWFKLGKALYLGKVSDSDNSIVYLLLSIFGVGIVNYCLIQSDLNKVATTSVQ